MDPFASIPAADTLPAPASLFNSLDIPLFFVSKKADQGRPSFSDVATKKLSLLLPFAIAPGVAPLRCGTCHLKAMEGIIHHGNMWRPFRNKKFGGEVARSS